MGSTLLVGTLAGMAAGTILAFLSHIAPRFGAGNFIPERDQPRVFGKSVSRREAHLIGLLVHLSLSALFGFLFALSIALEVVPRYSYGAMLLFVLVITFITGLIVMPIEGHGIFGRKHDAWFMVDAFITNVFWGHLFLVLIRLWQPL